MGGIRKWCNQENLRGRREIRRCAAKKICRKIDVTDPSIGTMNVQAQSRDRLPLPTGNLLDIRDLCVFFRDDSGWLQPLKDVSLTVKPGEVVGLVGESGCGKSLTALSVLNLLPARGCRRTGQILFDGDDLVQFSEAKMRRLRGRQIAMIFQEPMSALDPVFTVGKQISETLRVHFDVSQKQAEERAVAALADVGIASPRNVAAMYPMSLSGGMRQRVMIAIALVCEPRLLIADEPTTALDVTIQAQIMDLLLELGSRTGIAILFITHNLGLVAESCSRMLTMYAGEIVEDGPVQSILSRPLHPYTAGLLSSLPRQQARKSRLSSIPGRVPSAAEMPPGCRFGPRCNYVEPACGQPQQLLTHGMRHVRCWRHEALSLAGSMS
jgi:peptide/nickel transport system ATP-binding protein